MDRQERLLEEKLAAVDSLNGDAKVDALAAVVKELVAERRGMHAWMREGKGMKGMKGMMGTGTDSGVPEAGMDRKHPPGP